jgi:trans-aconitate methyltransferase
METIRGKMSLDLDQNALNQRLVNHRHIALDLGTGDGRFVCHMAARHPDRFFIGMDTCRENLRSRSQQQLSNALFIIASAHSLPAELNGRIASITINFPWGSLLTGLLSHDAELLAGLTRIAASGAALHVHINGDGMRSVGLNLEAGATQLVNILDETGWEFTALQQLDAATLRSLSSTWAKRLAFGRDPRAVCLSFNKK